MLAQVGPVRALVHRVHGELEVAQHRGGGAAGQRPVRRAQHRPPELPRARPQRRGGDEEVREEVREEDEAQRLAGVLHLRRVRVLRLCDARLQRGVDRGEVGRRLVEHAEHRRVVERVVEHLRRPGSCAAAERARHGGDPSITPPSTKAAQRRPFRRLFPGSSPGPDLPPEPVPGAECGMGMGTGTPSV
eukprot:gene492-biopygen8137